MIIIGGFDGNRWLNDVYMLDAGKLEMKELEAVCSSAAISNMKKIINEKTFADVSFIVEGKPLYAHKAILSA